MRRIVGFLLLILTIQAGVLLVRARGQQGGSPYLRDTTPAQLEATYIHGTIDVVVSTREGFVLATDSRATLTALNGDESHSDDAQKAFTIGNHAACVIAGLIGSNIQMEGFKLRDAMGTHLVLLDRQVSAQNRPISATEIGKTFSFGLESVAGLLTPTTGSTPAVVGAVSAVSVSPEGEPDWVTFYLPLEPRSDGASGMYLAAGKPEYLHHSQNIGLRFGVEAIGYPFLVQELIKANGPSGQGFSRSSVMNVFYERKQQGHLDEYSLEEATKLAKALVSATIASAPPQAGVGGSIDVLTVTKSGVHWMQRKERSTPFSPPYQARFILAKITGGKQPLDRLECVRCTFRDIEFSYAGDGDVELLAPVIEGHCRLKVSPAARRKMPLVVERLKRALADKCEITEGPDPIARAFWP